MDYLELILINKSNLQDKLIRVNDLEKEIYNFNSRELYILDGKNSFDISSLVIKKNCILLKLDFIRIIAFKEKVYLVKLKSEPFKKIYEKLNNYILKFNDDKKFHLYFLDFVFTEILMYFDELIKGITLKISNNNELIKSGSYTYSSVREIQSNLLSLEYRIKEIKSLLEELSDNKGDIKELTLDQKNIDDVEEMIETYFLKFQDLSNDISRLTREMDNVQKLVNIDLAKKRNLYAVFNIYLSIISLSLSFGSFIGSMFGMNLRNNFEKSNLAFTLAFILSLLIILISISLQILYFRNLINI